MSKAKDILKKIEENKIEPKSKWKFLLKDYLMWVFFGAAILIGSVTWSVIFFMLTDNDWDVYRYLDKSFSSYIILSFPYIWVIILALFSFLAYFNYTHTKTGYKVNPVAIVAVSVLVSIFFGGILFASGFGKHIDYALSQNLPHYEKMIIYRQAIWNNPEKGLLGGEILKIKNKDNFFIEAVDGKRWEIVGDDIVWMNNVPQKTGLKVKIIGKQGEREIFYAEEVRPWIGRRMHSDLPPRGIMHNNNAK